MVVEENHSDDGESSAMKGDKKHRLKQRFDVRQKLGQGTYGKVQLAVNRETGQEVAIKTIKKSKIESEQDLVRIRREIQIMSSIQHPHIIHIYEVFENKDKIVLVMQFASGGELYDYLSEKKVLSDLEARRIFRQIAAAVYYCHKNRICHRDLKLENILLDEKGNAKIADFGLSNVFDERHLLRTYCGSPLYASPEIVKGVPYCGPEVDCWSMGVLLYTLVYGAMPFDGSNFKKLVTQISEGDYFEPKKKSKATDLIHRLLEVSPVKRATIVDICTDHWVNQSYEHSLLQVAEDMANLTPVRLDLLLALAPVSPVPSMEDLKEISKASDDNLKKDNLEEERKELQHEEGEDDEDEEDDEEDEGPETMANSFDFVRGSQVSDISSSSPNLQKLTSLVSKSDEEEFLHSGLAAALEGQCSKRAAERSFDSSLVHVSSTAHKSKKTRKSNSVALNTPPTTLSNSVDNKENNCNEVPNTKVNQNEVPNTKLNENEVEKDTRADRKLSDASETKGVVRKLSNCSGSGIANSTTTISKTDDEKSKKIGRPPGKIVIPKTFENQQSSGSPSPKSNFVKSSPPIDTRRLSNVQDVPNVSETNIKSDSSSETVGKVSESVSAEKKLIAKGVLKKGIAKAKLAERKLSQQSSVDSDVSTPATPSSAVKSPENVPSYYRTPKPYNKDDHQQQMKSKAEITLSTSARPCDGDIGVSNNSSSNAPLWDSVVSSSQSTIKPGQNRNLSWGTISSTLDAEMSGWKEQMEESLRRLSPDGSAEPSVSPVNLPCRILEDDKPLVPIARSYKKFTFTKDGACITETKKIYTTPGADGSWTKVEKKTKITTRPGNVEEFERFRDLHLRNDSPLTRSDSQSSSGSNEVYDDIFDSWTGDTMMCNMMKIKNMFHKFAQDPFMNTDRRRNPFRNFRRTESDRKDRFRRPELRSGHSIDKEASDIEDNDFDVGNPVVYGSQGLWQFLKPPSKRLPRRLMMSPADRSSFTRSISQDRSGSNWKHCESRASSGYNTNSRSQSPHEKVLRFVFESPSGDYESTPRFKKTNDRRDSGINSDSEGFYRRAPSDEFSKSGRVSPISTAYSSTGRPSIIREFVKSWPKEMLGRHSLSNEPSDNRKTKVEQWLHMNDDSFPFGFYSDVSPKVGTSRIHENVSSAYATMRPREYLKYGRSSSDKVADCSDFFQFEESPRFRTMLSTDQEVNRMRSSTYSPVSEESNRDSQSLRHSDSSQSNTSVHHINLTISDGRISSQSTSPTVHVCEGERRTDGSSICVEQVSPKGGQPVVQMRVSFNRGGKKGNNTCPSSPPASTGLWQQQQGQLNQPAVVTREISPVPGIKKFSTEMVHTVGNVNNQEKNRGKHFSGPSSIECEVKTTQKGKLFHHDCSDACLDSCMECAMKNTTNLNLCPQSDVTTPDSLEDSVETVPLDIQPLGILWKKYDVSNDVDDNLFPKSSGIWEQRDNNNSKQTFDLIKELLADDGLDNSPFRSTDGQHFLEKRELSPIGRLSVLDTISVIGDKSAKAHELNRIVPTSLMDELQSPQKVLHQALRIGKFLETCE